MFAAELAGTMMASNIPQTRVPILALLIYKPTRSVKTLFMAKEKPIDLFNGGFDRCVSCVSCFLSPRCVSCFLSPQTSQNYFLELYLFLRESTASVMHTVPTRMHTLNFPRSCHACVVIFSHTFMWPWWTLLACIIFSHGLSRMTCAGCVLWMA